MEENTLQGEVNQGKDIELGGKITLSGFHDVEPGKLVVIKKIVGNYVKKMEEKTQNFEKVSVHLKTIHNSEFEVQTKLAANGRAYSADVTDFNLFFAMSRALDKILSEI
ncbi:hypothetical protein HY500_01165 [Candidatus Woesearchaeota archaeon]|nr:hypothetical protein [Candidatus Woesearchaeota archaeon]